MFGRWFIFLAAALLVGVAVACAGDNDVPDGTATVAPTDTPEVASQATATPLATAVVVTRTDVVTFVPPPGAATTVTGNCFGQSIPVTRLGAWRCIASNQIYDPCFGAQDARTVICVRNPAKPEDAVQMDLLSRACENAVLGNAYCELKELPPPAQQRPWAFQTAQGSICTLLQGTIGQWNGEPVPYGCHDGVTVLGVPAEGTVWTVRVVEATGSSMPVTVALVTVWI